MEHQKILDEDHTMLLAQLYDQLAPSFPAYARKDLQTAVRVLAKALQCPDPQHCPLNQYNRPLPTLYRLVEDYLNTQGKSLHTIRNTKNNLSRLFRLAEQRQLFSLAPVPLTPRHDPKHRPIRPGAEFAQQHSTYLVYAQWPIDLQEAFIAFQTWGTAFMAPGREAHLRKRSVTIKSYRQAFEGYFGYLHFTAHLLPTFDHLFDINLITNYVHWHINDCHKRPTIAIRLFLTRLLTLTIQYRPNSELHKQLIDLKKTIPIPPPTYNKDDAWVPLATLDEIGRKIWPWKKPKRVQYGFDSGTETANHAGLSLMLRLWTYIPYRRRNMCEMQLGENLHKDAQGRWHITFCGEQLKVAARRSRINKFAVPFPEALVPYLEDYLTIWRPLLLAKAPQPSTYVFLTRRGTPYLGNTLSNTTKNLVFRYTGKYWHPHNVRSVWATEWIRNGGDFYKAAYMLNDKLETVIASYAYLREENVAEEVFNLLDQRNGHGK
jgi:hypothetical protein